MARATSTAAPTTQPEVPTRRPVKIKVKLTRNPAGSYEVKSSHNIPDSNIVKAYMSKKAMPIINTYWYRGAGVRELINATMGQIRPKEWADAIAKATAQVLNQDARVDTELLAVEGGGYLAIGNALFQLSVVDYIESGPKALRVVRQQAIDAAKQEATSIITAAQVKADDTRAKGDTYYREQVAKGQTLLRQQEDLRQQLIAIPPEWCRISSIPVSVRNGYLFVGLVPKIKIQFFEWRLNGHKARITAADALSVPILVWAPLEPFYPNAMGVDQNFGQLPHMSSTACVEIGDAPKAITGLDSLNRLKLSIERAFSIVNMDSPLSIATNWNPGIRAFIPDKLKPVFANWYDRGDLASLLAKHRIQPDAEPPTDANAHVFTVRDEPLPGDEIA